MSLKSGQSCLDLRGGLLLGGAVKREAAAASREWPGSEEVPAVLLLRAAASPQVPSPRLYALDTCYYDVPGPASLAHRVGFDGLRIGELVAPFCPTNSNSFSCPTDGLVRRWTRFYGHEPGLSRAQAHSI